MPSRALKPHDTKDSRRPGRHELRLLRALGSIERSGWAFARALMPFGLIAFITAVAVQFVADPSWLPPETGYATVATAAIGGAVRVYERQQARTALGWVQDETRAEAMPRSSTAEWPLVDPVTASSP